MARRPSLIKVKAKAQKKSKTEQYLINHKGFGDEPVFTSKEVTQGQLHRYYNWYNAMCDVKEAREYLVTYLRNTNRLDDIKRLKDVNDKWLPTTVCWIARMRSQGANLPESTIGFFQDRLETALSEGQRRALSEIGGPEGIDPPLEKKATQKPSVQDRMSALLDGLISELEEEIDKFHAGKYVPTGFNMYDWLRGKQVPQVQAKRIHDFYNPQLLEIEDYVEGRLTEGYEGYSKANLQKIYGFYVMIVEDCEQFCQNEKKVRKPRTPKPMTADKKLKDFKHMSFDNNLKLQSIQPEKLLGAAELWTFNTKYNQLTVFRMAEQSNGLDVHRTAITSFDPKTSMTKKLKAKDVSTVLNEVLKGGKIVLRKLMENTRGSDQKMQERMNENTLLLRVVPR